MFGREPKYNPNTSIFAGMSRPALQLALSNAQTALLQLQTGAKVVTASYTQGDGAKSVTYTQASIGGLVMVIKQLQAQLGIVRHPRRGLQFGFH